MVCCEGFYTGLTKHQLKDLKYGKVIGETRMSSVTSNQELASCARKRVVSRRCNIVWLLEGFPNPFSCKPAETGCVQVRLRRKLQAQGD